MKGQREESMEGGREGGGRDLSFKGLVSHQYLSKILSLTDF
jgi:hypothetical protein